MRFIQGRIGSFAAVLFAVLSMVTHGAKADEGGAAPVEGQANTLSASATGVSELPEVTVKAKGIDQAAAFDQMHHSLNKVNILSQDQINQTPAKTIAEAANQLPGVGTQHDTGEARYIDIRGTDSNLNIITFNNTLIPSYDEANRSVDLDDIPAGLVGEMEVFKTILPDMDAQGVGGQMNLVPKRAQDYPGGLFELKAEGGIVPERNQPTVAGNLTWADTLDMGGPSKLGILVTTSYEYERFGIDDLENGYSDPADPPLVPNSVTDYDFRYYIYERDRAGIGANIDLSMDKENKLYANVLYSGYDEYRNPVWHTDIKNLDAEGGAIVNSDGSITIPDVNAAGVQVKKSMTNELTEFRTMAAGLGGENNLGGFILDYKASIAYTDQNVPFNFGYGFKNTNLTGSLTYNNTANSGNSPSINLGNMTGQNDASQFNYTGSDNGTSDYNVVQYGLKAEGKFDTPLGGDDTGTVKFGGAARLEYSVFNQVSLTSDQTGSLTMDQVLDPNNYTFYPGNLYDMGPLPSLTLLTNALKNPNAYQGPYTQEDPVGDLGGDYNNWEDVYAGYAMYTVKSGAMEVMGGARVEATHIQYNWNQSYAYDAYGNVDPDTELSAPVAHTGVIDYTNVLPSLGLKYSFNSQFVTRTNYSQTIARPTQSQYIPSFSLGQALDAQSGNSIVSFTFGNPDLKPMISNNIDSSWEFYPAKGAILAADFFLKDIANYFATDYSKADGSGGVTNTVSYINIPYSRIYGAEFQYQQQYTMLPDPLDGLGLRGSISFMGSQGEVVPNVYSELPSQSDLIWNAGVFYKKGGFSFDVGGSFTGKNLTVIGDPSQDNSPNIYYDDYFQIDAKAQYAFSKNFSIFADGHNLNNANHRFYQGAPNFPIQNEYYGPSFDGGLVVDF